MAWSTPSFLDTLRAVDAQYRRLCKRLGSALKRRRLELGLSQEGAAEAIGITPRHYQKIEAGSVNVTLRTLAKITSALHLPLNKMF